MSKIPEDLLYSKTHEWFSSSDGILTIGVTDYAQHQLTDVVYVDFPNVGTRVTKDGPLLTIESVKSAEDVFSPVDGTVEEINGNLENKPELINEDPYSNWLVKIKLEPGSSPDGMSADEYRKHIGE
ncbi:MAG: glycine cleavage system protein GcvH [Candidatus Thermoplasmatota archaeon]|nr:glycine cleavage system protein GcvH [Candidatus Thermoplasmatota archaeon]